MKKRVIRSMICFLMAVILLGQSQLGTFTTYAAEIQEEIMPTASSYLYPFEEAVTVLEELTATKDIQAVVYLDDSVMMRQLPNEESEPVKELVSS